VTKKKETHQNGVEIQADIISDEQNGGSAIGKQKFPIVGIGASAGGLEAFESFFQNVKADCGMAFVLVPHLDPGHPSILDEILQRITTLPVTEADDQTAVLPNRVYIIPPNRDMAILNGELQLSVPDQPRGLRMPIDHFLRSLADDQAEMAIGIILSGTGTDGTLGLRAIHGVGGLCLVQEPDSAKYDGMPQSAIQAGYATHIMPAAQMPNVLLDILHRRVISVDMTLQRPAELSVLKQIILLLRSGTGHDFSQYKRSTLSRRIERRMAQNEIQEMAGYLRFLKEHKAELKILFKELLINVTSFFRDPEAFIVLKQEILPLLLANKAPDYEFRIWVAACATGEEAYSIAILLRELMDEGCFGLKVQIYATDLSEDAIAVARAGRYPPNIAQDMPAERLQRFFVKEEDGYYRVKKEIREMIIFALQSVIKDPPFSKLDLLSCRNLLIYLEPELQDRLIFTFHSALKPNGVLFLSASENITHHPEFFPALNRKWKFFRALHTVASTHSKLSGNLVNWAASRESKPLNVANSSKSQSVNFAELTSRALLQSYAPASVLTDMHGNILYIHGDTGRYLRPAPGQATLNVIEMAREGLQFELRTAVLAAIAEGAPVQGSEVSVKSDSGIVPIRFSLRTLPVQQTGERLLLMTFEEIPPPVKSKARLRPATADELTHEARRNQELERELSYSRQNLQSSLAEQQATNEELKSTNEEMQSTNEELQSSNEELETSREELQSLNEELLTVNAELHSKIDQLTVVRSDLKNLLDNVNIGTIFLDAELRIRRYTREAVKIYYLTSNDVGRPLAHIKSTLKIEGLLDQSKHVLDTLEPYEEVIQTDTDEYYLTRIQPYRTVQNVIDGVVVTFTDITKRAVAESALQLAQKAAEAIVDTVREPFLVLDEGLNVILASRAFYHAFEVSREVTLGRPIFQLGDRQWDIPQLRKLLEKILQENEAFDDYVVEHDFPTIGLHRVVLNARRICGESGNLHLILLAMTFEDQRQGD
jgi:two-component system CheB/CheR fusion protein